VARMAALGLVLKEIKESDKQQKESPPVESRGSEWTSCFLNSLSERSLGVAGSSPRVSQWFLRGWIRSHFSMFACQSPPRDFDFDPSIR